MEADFGHPLWISSGLLLMLVGFWLFRWASRNSAAGEIANATKEVAINKLLKGSQGTRSVAGVKKFAGLIISAARCLSSSASSASC